MNRYDRSRLDTTFATGSGLLIITKPLGIYLLKVLDPDQGGRTFLDPILGPVERLIYAICRINGKKQQNWKQYALSMLFFSAVGMLLTYGLLRMQDKLPLNPQSLAAVPDALAFNTAASFTANTCWQSYGGEGTMSYFSQMVALVSQNFMSSAVGLAVCAGLVRGIARRSTREIGQLLGGYHPCVPLSVPADLPGLRALLCLLGQPAEL